MPGDNQEVAVKVRGEPFTDFPADLYIPPQALQIFLETFSGPLDLLLYLIKKDNIDILDIPIAQITEQYMAYVEMMQSLNLELAAEYLVMAAVLAEIKSKLLLPKPNFAMTEEETDPRAVLVQRLREYEQFKQAAQDLDALPQMQRDIFPVWVQLPELKVPQVLPRLELQELLDAFHSLMLRTELQAGHQIIREVLSVRERMSNILSALQHHAHLSFAQLVHPQEGRMGVVVTFIAILELLTQHLIEIIQTEIYGTIHLRLGQSEEQADGD